jgi:hypothetical protein
MGWFMPKLVSFHLFNLIIEHVIYHLHYRLPVSTAVTGYPSNNFKKFPTFDGAATWLMGQGYRTLPMFSNGRINPPADIMRAHEAYQRLRLNQALHARTAAEAATAAAVDAVAETNDVPPAPASGVPRTRTPAVDPVAAADAASWVPHHAPTPHDAVAPATPVTVAAPSITLTTPHTELIENVPEVLDDDEGGYSTAPTSRSVSPAPSDEHGQSLAFPSQVNTVCAASDEVISLPDMPSSSFSPLPNTSSLGSGSVSGLSSVFDILSIGSKTKKNLTVPSDLELAQDIEELPRAIRVFLETHNWSSQTARLIRTLSTHSFSAMDLQEVLIHLGMDKDGASYISRLLGD